MSGATLIEPFEQATWAPRPDPQTPSNPSAMNDLEARIRAANEAQNDYMTSNALQGEQGEDGERGPKGDKGDIGATGPGGTLTLDDANGALKALGFKVKPQSGSSGRLTAKIAFGVGNRDGALGNLYGTAQGIEGDNSLILRKREKENATTYHAPEHILIGPNGGWLAGAIDVTGGNNDGSFRDSVNGRDLVLAGKLASADIEEIDDSGEDWPFADAFYVRHNGARDATFGFGMTPCHPDFRHTIVGANTTPEQKMGNLLLSPGPTQQGALLTLGSLGPVDDTSKLLTQGRHLWVAPESANNWPLRLAGDSSGPFELFAFHDIVNNAMKKTILFSDGRAIFGGPNVGIGDVGTSPYLGSTLDVYRAGVGNASTFALRTQYAASFRVTAGADSNDPVAMLETTNASDIVISTGGGQLARARWTKDGKFGAFGKAPVFQQGIAAPATDAATTQTLVNAIRQALINYGWLV